MKDVVIPKDIFDEIMDYIKSRANASGWWNDNCCFKLVRKIEAIPTVKSLGASQVMIDDLKEEVIQLREDIMKMEHIFVGGTEICEGCGLDIKHMVHIKWTRAEILGHE